MQRFSYALAASLTLATPLGTSALAAQERVIAVDQRVLPIQIDGQDIAMEIAPDAPASPVLSAETAQRLGLEGSMVQGVHLVGRTKLKAQSNRVKIAFDARKPQTRRAFFFDGDWHGLGAAMINPAALPDSIITYRLRAPAAGERVITLPLLQHDRAGFYTELTFGEDRVPTFFSFARGETMATAAAGAVLANAFAGEMAGPAREIAIEFGISRPVRAMRFAATPMLGGLPLASVVVRTQDTGSTAAIPDDERDPNEIVVTGGKRKPLYRLWVGTDSLSACSSLTFDRAAEEIRLSCAAE